MHINGSETLTKDCRPVTLSRASLPQGDEVLFPESTFFQRHGKDWPLPSPAEIRKCILLNGPTRSGRSEPVRFERLNLLVKAGTEVTIAEGQCLWALRQLLADRVRVPEVYGWQRDGSETFIYMELIEGITLMERWQSLTSDEKRNLADQLGDMIKAWRQLKQDPGDQFLGSISRQPLLDIMFEYLPPAGPFSTVEQFNEWYSTTAKTHHPAFKPFDDPFRAGLSDDAPIMFTHGDLHRGNIIVSRPSDGPARILAIVDWHGSGWYPEYWEFCKAVYTADSEEDWAEEYIPRFLDRPDAVDSWCFYMQIFGC
ncbi:MAG: hypothetical protein M1817_004804 [Caeruleum heppii]|nr:MAG: hypothetical protein M1817_004804 [Caeruleum heppii]